jgi:hypothetical protein
MELQVADSKQLARARNARWRASPQGQAWGKAHEGTPGRRAQKAKAASTFRKAHPERARAWTQAWRLANPLKAALIRAHTRATKKKIEFSITEADFLSLPTHCPVLGIELKYGGGRGRKPVDDAASIDRRDNSLGYIPGNVFVICSRANKIKNEGTAAEHRAIAAWMEMAGGDHVH